MLPRVKSVTYLDGYRLKIRFTNKTEGIIDFRQRILGRGGVFKPLEDIEFFKQVVVDKESGTLLWPNEVDFCPDVLYRLATSKEASGAQATTKTMQSLQPEMAPA